MHKQVAGKLVLRKEVLRKKVLRKKVLRKKVLRKKVLRKKAARKPKKRLPINIKLSLKNKLYVIILLFTVLTGWINAHPKHDKKPALITQSQALSTASHHVKRLVKSGKLGKSWKDAIAVKAAMERRSSRDVWVVSFNRQVDGGQKDKTLYVFLTNTGYYNHNNFTGK
ncbi:DUF6488 family protein [Aliikangiella coralliicola]|uniref:Uncharacterized protein n=1 Tax=Aliikangiella coralliicola TaxID=2592383 RepID=A0A545U4D6_9GAMM|nr:DUF6488 family protein [Aliikangiella coralliicola]TQV84335.1 hypothetical protein FLL46_22175 [Aliikangiella coralliicola]